MPSNPSTLYEKVDRWVVRCIKGISYVSGVCLVAIMLVAFFNVLGEKLRQAGLPVTGIPASTEIVQYLHVPMVFLAAAYVTLDRGHTHIDLLSSKFPRPVQAFFTVLGSLFGAFISGFISYRGLTLLERFLRRNMMSSVTGIGFPLWPFALILSLGFALLAFSFLWAIVRYFHGTAQPDQPPEKTEGGEG